jgi:hypothetical protein
MLRCCDENMMAYEGFQWPESGAVEPVSWSAKAKCGNGLHGWLMGEGNRRTAEHVSIPSAKWLICAVWADDLVDLAEQVKAPRAWVLHVGSRHEIASKMANVYGAKACMFATVRAGYGDSAAVGYGGTAIVGYMCTAIAGERGTATAGHYGTSIAGDYGTAMAGNFGTATAGYKGIATAGNYGKVRAGENGELQLSFDNSRRHTKVAYVGVGGIKANVFYMLDADGEFVEAEDYIGR